MKVASKRANLKNKMKGEKKAKIRKGIKIVENRLELWKGIQSSRTEKVKSMYYE